MDTWIKLKDQPPDDGRYIIMEVLLPADIGTTLRQFVYELGYYIDVEMEVSEEEQDLVQVSTYSMDNDGRMLLPSGFYRVYTDWEGTHIHQLGGEVVRWKTFL